MSQSEILKEIVRIEMILEDIRLGLRPESEEAGYRDDLRALRQELENPTPDPEAA